MSFVQGAPCCTVFAWDVSYCAVSVMQQYLFCRAGCVPAILPSRATVFCPSNIKVGCSLFPHFCVHYSSGGWIPQLQPLQSCGYCLIPLPSLKQMPLRTGGGFRHHRVCKVRGSSRRPDFIFTSTLRNFWSRVVPSEVSVHLKHISLFPNEQSGGSLVHFTKWVLLVRDSPGSPEVFLYLTHSCQLLLAVEYLLCRQRMDRHFVLVYLVVSGVASLSKDTPLFDVSAWSSEY